MRQGGMKPKSHESGVYWTRAASGKTHSEKTAHIGFLEIVFILIILPFLLLAFIADEAIKLKYKYTNRRL